MNCDWRYSQFRNKNDGMQLSVAGHPLKVRLNIQPKCNRSQKILASLAEEPWQTLDELQYTWNMQDKYAFETVHNLLRSGLIEQYTNDKYILYGIANRPLELLGYKPLELLSD